MSKKHVKLEQRCASDVSYSCEVHNHPENPCQIDTKPLSEVKLSKIVQENNRKSMQNRCAQNATLVKETQPKCVERDTCRILSAQATSLARLGGVSLTSVAFCALQFLH